VAWVRFLALTAAHPERLVQAATVGRALSGGRNGAVATVVRLPRLDPETALAHLAALVEIYDRGMREPLPIACRTSAAYASALRNGGDPRRVAAEEWTSGWNFPKEDQDLEHQLVFGGILSFEDLSARAGFDRYAQLLWDEALGWEEVDQR
jgi:exodeoxyribonuclease V gamma subunit